MSTEQHFPLHGRCSSFHRVTYIAIRTPKRHQRPSKVNSNPLSSRSDLSTIMRTEFGPKATLRWLMRGRTALFDPVERNLTVATLPFRHYVTIRNAERAVLD